METDLRFTTYQEQDLQAEAADARPLTPWQYLSDGLNHPVHDGLDIRALEHLAMLTKFNLVPLGDASEGASTSGGGTQGL